MYYPLGDGLAEIYNRKIPGLHATAEATVASVFNVEAIQRGDADLAFTQGDVAYVAFKRGTSTSPQPHTKLRGVAVLYLNVVQIVTNRDKHIDSVSDFRGRRIGVGAAASGTEVVARIIIEAHGLKYADVEPEFLSFSEVAEQLEKGSIDAGFVVASYPVAAIADASRIVDIRLIPVAHDVIERIRGEYPFLRPATVPRGTYRHQTDGHRDGWRGHAARMPRGPAGGARLPAHQEPVRGSAGAGDEARGRLPHRSRRRGRRRRFRCTRAPPGTIASASCCNDRQGPRRARRMRAADGFPRRRRAGRRQHAGARVRRPDRVVDARVARRGVRRVLRALGGEVPLDAALPRRGGRSHRAGVLDLSLHRRGDAVVVDRRLSRDPRRATATRSSRSGPCRTST